MCIWGSQVQYLSQHPQALVKVLLIGGLPPGISLPRQYSHVQIAI